MKLSAFLVQTKPPPFTDRVTDGEVGVGTLNSPATLAIDAVFANLRSKSAGDLTGINLRWA